MSLSLPILFLRYLTNDVPPQADAVEQLLHQAAAGQLTLVTHPLVIAEIVWTFFITNPGLRSKPKCWPF